MRPPVHMPAPAMMMALPVILLMAFDSSELRAMDKPGKVERRRSA